MPAAYSTTALPVPRRIDYNKSGAGCKDAIPAPSFCQMTTPSALRQKWAENLPSMAGKRFR